MAPDNNHTIDFSPLRASLRPFADAALSAQEQRLQDEFFAFYAMDFRAPLASLGLEQRISRMSCEGFDLALYHFRLSQPKARCFVLHGYYDHLGIYAKVIGFLLAENIEVLGFDLPGHGLSSGPRAAIDDFAVYRRCLEQVVSANTKAESTLPVHILGQSTGAAVIIDSLLHPQLKQKKPFSRVILLAPLIRPKSWLGVKLLHWLLRPFLKRIKRSFSNNSHDKDFLHFLAHQDPLQAHALPLCWVGALSAWIARIDRSPPCEVELIVVQGEEDDTVAWQRNLRQLSSLFARVEVLMLPEARHHLANETHEIRDQYQGWLRAKLD